MLLTQILAASPLLDAAAHAKNVTHNRGTALDGAGSAVAALASTAQTVIIFVTIITRLLPPLVNLGCIAVAEPLHPHPRQRKCCRRASNKT